MSGQRQKKRVLFVCTGNSARSQMAEGLVNGLIGECWEAESAGTAPASRVHPLAIAALAELGLDISARCPKPLAAVSLNSFDLAITLCAEACEACSVWLGGPPQEHIAFPDPAAVPGDEPARLQAFRDVRDEIRSLVLPRLQRAAPCPEET